MTPQDLIVPIFIIALGVAAIAIDPDERRTTLRQLKAVLAAFAGLAVICVIVLLTPFVLIASLFVRQR